MRDPLPPRSSALVELLAAEHRVRRQALRESGEADRWEKRAAFADARGLVDLAAAARRRAERHRRMARLLTGQALEVRDEIERLRADLEPRRGVGRSPPTGASFDARFAELALEKELEAIRNVKAGSPPGPAPPDGGLTK